MAGTCKGQSYMRAMPFGVLAVLLSGSLKLEPLTTNFRANFSVDRLLYYVLPAVPVPTLPYLKVHIDPGRPRT